MKSHLRSIFSNFFALSIIQGINFIIPLIVMPFVISRIGVENFGVIAIAQVVMVYLTTLADYGFNLTATKDISVNKYNENSKYISQIFITVLVTKILISFFAFVLLLLLIEIIPFLHSVGKIYLFGFTYVVGQSLLVSWFFQGMEKMRFITYSVLIARIIFVVMIFFFVEGPGDTYLFLFFFGLGSILAGLFSIYIAWRIFKIRLVQPKWLNIKLEIYNGWQITLSNIFINTYLYSNIFLLRFFANDLVVGYYSIAERIFFAIRQMLGIYSQVIYPKICQITRQGKYQTAIFLKQVYQPFLLTICMGCLSVFIFSKQIISIFTDTGSVIPEVILKMLSFVPVVVCLNIPAYQVLLSFDLKRSYLRVLTAGTILNILINLYLAKIWGAYGTATAIIITEVFITVALNAELYKQKLIGYIKQKMA